MNGCCCDITLFMCPVSTMDDIWPWSLSSSLIASQIDSLASNSAEPLASQRFIKSSFSTSNASLNNGLLKRFLALSSLCSSLIFYDSNFFLASICFRRSTLCFLSGDHLCATLTPPAESNFFCAWSKSQSAFFFPYAIMLLLLLRLVSVHALTPVLPSLIVRLQQPL